MAYGITIAPQSPELQKLSAEVLSALLRVNRACVSDAANLTRMHLGRLDAERPNRLGGSRTHFYRGFAQGVQAIVNEEGGEIRIADSGKGGKGGVNLLATKLYGHGEITPKGTSSKTGKPLRYLTIPANSETYAHRAGEFDLEFARVGGLPCLVVKTSEGGTYATRGVRVYQDKKGKWRKTYQREKAHEVGDVMFWLARKVKAAPADPTVLPTPEEYQASIQRTLSRMLARQGGLS